MGRQSAKRGKPTERRSHPRSSGSEARTRKKSANPSKASKPTEEPNKTISKKRTPSEVPAQVLAQDHCSFCAKSLRSEERVLFVEEDLGKVFCSEGCITSYFAPEIEKLERDYFRQLSPEDLSGGEREKLAHLRWITLEQPDEVWREKTISGFNRYTLISEFKPSSHRVWCVCICLFLRGEPSFLYLAFTTKNAAMVDYYRRGEQIPLSMLKANLPEETPATKTRTKSGAAGDESEEDPEKNNFNETSLDRLAESWSEDETVLSQNQRSRRKDDIQPDEYAQYQGFLEQTLENPEELWSSDSKKPTQDAAEALRIFHFIRYYNKHENGPFWYVIIARELLETEQEPEDKSQSIEEQMADESQQMEILEAFPTRDPDIVQQYRVGKNELSEDDEAALPPGSSRVVH